MNNAAHAPYVADKDPRFVEALRMQTGGNMMGARTRLEQLLHEQPDNPDLLHANGTTYLIEGRPEEAAAYFQRAVNANPDQPRYALHLSIAHKHAGDMHAAADALYRHLKKHPGEEQLFIELYNLCMDIGRYATTEEIIRLRYAANPADLLNNTLMVVVLEAQDRKKEKLPFIEFIYKNTPQPDVALYINYSKALRDNGRLMDAIAVVNEAEQRFPNVPDLINIQAAHAFAEGDHAGALKLYEKALMLDPMSDATRTSMGMMKMMLTDLKEGYEDYACRPNLQSTHRNIIDHYPRWQGEALQGKKLLLWTEQGVGDIVMFSSLMPWVQQQGAEIMVLALPKMIPLLQRSFPGVHFMPDLHIVHFGGGVDRTFDYQLPMGELLRLALPHYTPSGHKPFLQADAGRAEKLRKCYEAIAAERGAKRIIGISWHSKNDDNNYRRNIPLAEWGKLFEIPGILWVSLQYGDFSAEIAAAKKQFGNVLYEDAEVDGFEDIDGLAAQMMAMDEIVSIQNATVHMGGGLGVPTTIMLNAASDWRWGLNPDKNKWYSSVTLERQKVIQDWQSVLERIAQRLRRA